MPPTLADLARLGIVDPNTGAPLPGGEEGYQQSTVDQYAEASEERAAAIEQGLGEQPGAQNWKQRAEAAEKLIQQNTPTVADALTAQQRQHQMWAAEAYDIAVRGGMNAQVAETIIRSEKEKLDAQAELAAHRQAALPMVRRGAAEEIAAEFSDPRTGIKIDPKELAPLGSMEAMRQTATVLKKEREGSSTVRDLSYANRLASGVDRAEGAPMQNGRARVPENISPTSRIAYGLERGHL